VLTGTARFARKKLQEILPNTLIVRELSTVPLFLAERMEFQGVSATFAA
jgi:hypothetical protein